MLRLELLKEEERQALVKLFADDKMYCSIRSTCMRVMNDAKEIKLHPVELFYLSLCVIDRMKGLTANEAVAYVLDEAWYEGQEYFIKVYGEDSDVERNAALGLILQTCAEWLLRSHDTSKIQIVTALKNLMVHKIGGDFSEKMDGEFRRGFRSIDENQFALIVNDYLQSDRLLSEEIDKVLDGYIAFYMDRLDRGLAADRAACPYTYEYLSDRKAVKKNMLANPFEKFERKRFMYYSKDLGKIALNTALFNSLKSEINCFFQCNIVAN